MKWIKELKRTESGFAVVEATILYAILFLTLFMIILISMYLPTKAALQNATQKAATAIALEQSDTWLNYNEDSLVYTSETNKSSLDNVYVSLFNGYDSNDAAKAKDIVQNALDESLLYYGGTVDVDYGMVNKVIYKEVVVSATYSVDMPIDLSFIGGGDEIEFTVTSCATVQNGDEFVRNVDIVVDVVKAIDEKYDISSKFEGVTDVISKVTGFLGN